MAEDIKLEKIHFIPETVLARLINLEIHTVRQLFARLQGDELEDYLELSDEDFTEFRQKVEEFIHEKFPGEDIPRIHPAVNKRGVAVHRLDDSTRPRFFGRK